jgi:internalin A
MAAEALLEQIEQGVQKRPLNEAKVLIVGQAEVGKTSLINRLTDKRFNRNEPKTEGIDIKHWPLATDESEIQLNIWDFGGQEIMQATHQFFFTQRSLYLLVLNSRLDETENRLYYWLNMIETFGENSPIIIVCNKSDVHPFDYDWDSLKADHQTIRFIAPRVSCMTDEGIDELKKSIKQEIANLEHVNDELPKSWLNVKRELEESKQQNIDYIPYETYHQICLNHNVDAHEDQHTLIQLLHDLGVVLYFHDHPLLRYANILNPEWVTQGVYKILNDRKLSIEEGGVLRSNELGRILDAPVKYPPHRHEFLIGMMEKFQVCFRLPQDADIADERYMIPDILPRKVPPKAQNPANWSNTLTFQYHYKFLPSSVIPRFIVQMHDCIFENFYWRDGVVLTSDDGENEALIKADSKEQKIFISVGGIENTRRTFLKTIRDTLDSIHKPMPKIEAREKVPLPEHTDIVVDYQHLLTLDEHNVKAFIPEGLVESVQVKPLLYRIDPIRADELENIAETFAKRVLWGIGGAFVTLSILLLILIPLFGWNKMEPWTFVFGTIVGIVSVFVYLPLALRAKDPSLSGIYDYIVEWRKKRLLHKL